MATDVTSARDHLVAALEADLIGPFDPPDPPDADGVEACVECCPCQPQPAITVRLALDAGRLVRGVEVDGAPGVWLQGRLADLAAPGLRSGTRALSLFLVNQEGKGGGRADEQFVFQAEMTLAYEGGFVARPNARGDSIQDCDEQVADLQFRSCHEWAVGHGVATVATTVATEAPDGVVRRVATK